MGREPLPPPRAPLSLFRRARCWCKAYSFVLKRKALAYLFVVGLFWLELRYVLIFLFVCIGLICLLIVLFFFLF
jgi:hypothetical protein